VAVGDGVFVAVGVGVKVGVRLGVAVGVDVDVKVAVGVNVFVGALAVKVAAIDNSSATRVAIVFGVGDGVEPKPTASQPIVNIIESISTQAARNLDESIMDSPAFSH
jgi:hypothetical protein